MTTFPRPFGSLSRRIHGAKAILNERADSARLAASMSDPNSQHAAALRGKARGYDEAGALLERIERGRWLGARRWVGGAS